MHARIRSHAFAHTHSLARIRMWDGMRHAAERAHVEEQPACVLDGDKELCRLILRVVDGADQRVGQHAEMHAEELAVVAMHERSSASKRPRR